MSHRDARVLSTLVADDPVDEAEEQLLVHEWRTEQLRTLQVTLGTNPGS